MADTNTPNTLMTIITIGGDNNTWGNLLNENTDTLDNKLGDTTSINTTGGTTVLTDQQELVAIVEVSGTLLSNAIVQFTGRGGFWMVRNAGTDAAFSLTCKLSGQTGVVIPGGAARVVFCDGTDIRLANTDTVLTPSTVPLITSGAVDDLMLLGDTSNGGLLSAVTVANFFNAIAILSAVTAPAIDDGLALYDLSGTQTGAISLLNLLKVVNGLTEDTTPDSANDFVLSFDVSAGLPKKVKPNNLAAASAATAASAAIAPGSLLGIIEDNKASGTNAAAIASGSWIQREINTILYDRLSILSVTSNQFTITAAGDYEIEWHAPISRGNFHQSRLFNVTGGSAVKSGESQQIDPNDVGVSTSRGIAHVTIAGSTVFRIDSQVSFSGLGGTAGNFGTEVYTRVTIRKG